MRSRSARLEKRLGALLRWLRREREEADAGASHSRALTGAVCTSDGRRSRTG